MRYEEEQQAGIQLKDFLFLNNSLEEVNVIIWLRDIRSDKIVYSGNVEDIPWDLMSLYIQGWNIDKEKTITFDVTKEKYER